MKFFGLWACLIATCLGKNPNILFVMLDDLGYGDLSARHAEFFTPNLDELYHNSIILDSHYIGISVCSPSRAQILTGRYAWNLGLASLSNFQTSSVASFPAGVPTIANLLKQHTEYRTYALGKWHVGYSTPEHTPLFRGFDEFYGFLTSGIDYYDKTMTQPIYDGSFIDWWANNEFDFDTQNIFSTQATGDRMIEIIDKHTYDNEYNTKPFYIYGSFQAPHENLQYVTSKYESNCDSLKGNIDIDDSSQVENTRYAYCLNIMKVDEMMEYIIQKLKDTHQWDNTMIVVTSDNGGAYMKGSCNYPLTGGKSTYFEGGVRTVAFVGGGVVKKSQRGSLRSGFMHGADWTPTLLSIAGANVGHVLSELETDVYTPISAKVSTKVHGTTEYSNDYLIDSPFDGIDLSDWILNGDESSNPRTDVPLSINSLPGTESDDEVENDDNNEEGDEEEVESEEARRLMKTDHDGGDISVVWKSEITKNTYKMIYSPSSSKLEKQTCKMKNNMVGVELSAFLTNKLLFDLTLDTREETNIMENVNEEEEEENNDGDDEDGSRRMLLKSKKKKKKSKKSKSKTSKKTKKIKKISDYTGDSDLAVSLWNEGLELAVGYRNNVMFNDYLGCAEKTFYQDGDPSQFDNQGWQPFFEFKEYTKKFENLCADDTNDVLYELYTTTYDSYVEAAQSRLESRKSDNEDDQDNEKNEENDDQSGEVEENNDQSIVSDVNGNSKTAGKSTSINTHMFGHHGSHTLMIAGIVLAVSLVVLGYCLFYFVKHQNEKKYQQYTVIGP